MKDNQDNGEVLQVCPSSALSQDTAVHQSRFRLNRARAVLSSLRLRCWEGECQEVSLSLHLPPVSPRPRAARAVSDSKNVRVMDGALCAQSTADV